MCTLSADMWSRCGQSLHKQMDSLRTPWFHNHERHSLKVHCSTRDSEEGKINGAIWHTALCTTRHGWDGCSATTSSPKPFLFLNDLLIVHIWHRIPTPRNWPSSQEYTGFDTHLTAPQPWGTGGWADIDNCWWNTPSHSPPHHPTIKTLPLSLSFALIQHALARGHSAIVPTFLSGDCVVGTLPVGSLAEAHNCWLCIKTPAKICVRWGLNPRLLRDQSLNLAPWTARPRALSWKKTFKNYKLYWNLQILFDDVEK